MALRKRNVLNNLLEELRQMNAICLEYEARTGAYSNKVLFDWVEKLDTVLERGINAHNRLKARLTNAQINALLDEELEPGGVNSNATMNAIGSAAAAIQTTFAAQLGQGGTIQARERLRQGNAWVTATNTAADRALITADVAVLRTALAPLVED